MRRRSEFGLKSSKAVLVVGTGIWAMVMATLPGLPASAAQPAPTTPAAPSEPLSADPSATPSTTIPPWDATPTKSSESGKPPALPSPPASGAQTTGFDEKLSTPVEAETTPTKRVYDNSDGSQTARISISPERFKDSSGTWIEHDLSIVTRPDGSLGAKAAPKAATLNKSAAGGLVTVQTSAGPVPVVHGIAHVVEEVNAEPGDHLLTHLEELERSVQSLLPVDADVQELVTVAVEG